MTITLAIFTNYPCHFYELPSPFLRITLAICANYPRHLCEIPSPPPQITLESPSPLYRITLAIWSIFPARLPGYTSTNFWNYVSIQVVVLLLITWVAMASSCTVETGQFDSIQFEPVGVGSPGSAILARVIRNTPARYRMVFMKHSACKRFVHICLFQYLYNSGNLLGLWYFASLWYQRSFNQNWMWIWFRKTTKLIFVPICVNAPGYLLTQCAIAFLHRTIGFCWQCLHQRTYPPFGWILLDSLMPRKFGRTMRHSFK